LLQSLCHFLRIGDRGDIREHSRFVKSPFFSSACGLNQCCSVGFWNMKT
jgi:hypothetical protein